MNFINVPKPFCIIDPRTKYPNNLTANFYKKNDIKEAFELAIKTNNIDEACRWAVEYHITINMMQEFWNDIFMLCSKYINIEQHISFYEWLFNKKNKWEEIIEWLKLKHELRNNQESRNMIIEIAIIIAILPKNEYLSYVPPITLQDFQDNIIQSYLTTDCFDNIKNYINPKDDTEIIMVLSEIYNILTCNLNTSALYWIYWLEKLTILKRKHNKTIYCHPRQYKDIPRSYWSDWIWILWSILFDIAKSINIDKDINLLYDLFKWNYKQSLRKQKLYIISHAILLIKSKMSGKYYSTKFIISNILTKSQYKKYLFHIGNINLLYKNIFNQMVNHPDYQLVDIEEYWIKLKKSIVNSKYTKYLIEFSKRYDTNVLEEKHKNNLLNNYIPKKIETYNKNEVISNVKLATFHNNEDKNIENTKDVNIDNINEDILMLMNSNVQKQLQNNKIINENNVRILDVTNKNKINNEDDDYQIGDDLYIDSDESDSIMQESFKERRKKKDAEELQIEDIIIEK